MGKIVGRKTRCVLETATCVRYKKRDREIILELHPHHADVRLKGTRFRFPITYESIYYRAGEIAAAAAKRARAEARKLKLKGTQP